MGEGKENRKNGEDVIFAVFFSALSIFLTSPQGHPKEISKNYRQKVWR
jgi:hypothetical protein